METGAGVHGIAAQEPRQHGGAIPLLPASARFAPRQRHRPGHVLARSPGELTEENFDEAHGALVGQYDKTVAVQALSVVETRRGCIASNQCGSSGQGSSTLTPTRMLTLTCMDQVHRRSVHAMRCDTLTGSLALHSRYGGNVHFWGFGGTLQTCCRCVL